MVLESLANPKNAVDKPVHVLVLSFIYSFIAVYFAHLLFPSQSSVLAIAFITMIFIPFFQKMFELDEEREHASTRHDPGDHLWNRHSDTIMLLSAFFLGVMFSLSFIFVFVPELGGVFDAQQQTLQRFTGNAASDGTLYLFLANNTQVMVLVFVLSLLFGAGSLFILAWNASVISVYLGLLVRSLADSGFSSATAYVYGIPLGLGSILLHGIPEIAAYFVAGIAGGILSVGLIREEFSSPEFMQILKDSLLLLGTAELLIILAAYIEVFI